MTGWWNGCGGVRARSFPAPGPENRDKSSDVLSGRCQPFRTVPLLCSGRAMRFQVEGTDQVEGCLAQVQVVERCPQVDDIAFRLAGRLKALIHVVGQMHAEGPPSAVAAMDRTRPAPLGAATAEVGQQTQVVEDAPQR